MSAFTHLICADCWNERNPNHLAHKVVIADQDARPCCFCGQMTAPEIYTRADPKTTKCEGWTGIHADKAG